jgi:hypothetical protein
MEIDVTEEKDTVSMDIEVKQQPLEISVTEIDVKEKPIEKVTTEIYDEESTLTIEVEGQPKPGQ